ncbi:MAG: aromatic amino acid transport family protein [Chlamydiales bacterium]
MKTLKINHFIGGIFLVAGTTIGVGMLGNPVTTGFAGFFPSILFFILCWLVMLASAFCFLDVNLAVRGEPNMISMAQKTLGTWGKVLSWVVYLLLLYSLLAAYILASAPIFADAFTAITSLELPIWFTPFLLPLIFGGFIYFGTEGVDLVNRLIMVGLLVSYFLLIGALPEHINPQLLTKYSFSSTSIALPVILTAFGYHIIIPSLTTYMKHDRKHLIYTIVVGSLLSLVAYGVWQFCTLGIVPVSGKYGIETAYNSGSTIIPMLAGIIKNRWVITFAQFFAFFAIVSSFLGVSLSLSDFLTDGFKIKKSWEGKLLAVLLTFVPPLFFVFSYREGFILALEYAGAFVAILLIFLPAAMAWTLKTPKFYRSFWGRAMLLSISAFALLIVTFVIIDQYVSA